MGQREIFQLAQASMDRFQVVVATWVPGLEIPDFLHKERLVILDFGKGCINPPSVFQGPEWLVAQLSFAGINHDVKIPWKAITSIGFLFPVPPNRPAKLPPIGPAQLPRRGNLRRIK